MLNAVLLLACFGFAAVFVLPATLKSTRYGTKIANAYARFTMFALRRPGLSFGKHADLTLRQLSYDDVFDAEEIESGGVARKVRRTAENVHRFGSTPFALIDEVYGVTFDLRDMAVAEREHRHREDGQMVRTFAKFNNEGEATRVENFCRGFFEFEKRPGLSLDIDDSVRRIVDGSERAHWHERMDEAVRRMFIDRQEGLPFLKLLVPAISLGIGLLLGFYVLGPGQLPGGDTGASPIDVGAMFAVSLSGFGGWARSQLARVRDGLSGGGGSSGGLVPWRRLGKTLAGLAILAGLAFAASAIGLFWSGVIGGSFLAGYAVLPLLLLLLGALGVGAGLGDLMLMAGLMGIREPVLDLTEDDQYRFVEADDLGLEDPPKAKLAWTLIGLSPEVSPEAFGHAGYDAADVEEIRDQIATDGGRDADDVLPKGYESTREITKANHSAFVPSDPDPSTTYVRADMWLARFRDAATGTSLDTAEKEARKEYAAGDPDLSDQRLMGYSALAAAGGFGFWVVMAFV